jgi:hypothetical protein
MTSDSEQISVDVLRLLLDDLADGTAKVAADGTIQSIDPQLATRLGRKASELVGTPYAELLEREFVGPFGEALDNAFARPGVLRSYDIAFLAPANGNAVLETRLIVPASSPSTALVVARDAGERADLGWAHEAETQLGERRKELRCLYELSTLFRTPGLTNEGMCEGVVAAMLPAWQYHDDTSIRVTLDDQVV